MTIQYIEGVARCRVDQLRIGQRVDLQNDIFADPSGHLAAEDGEGESEHPEFEFAFEVVLEMTVEATGEDACTRVDFESGFSCGFPPEHMVEVDAEQEEFESHRPEFS